LRLEVCYPLHGNDIDPDTDPVSAGLGWTCALEKEFTGVDVIRRIREEGPEERLIAFVLEEPGVPRPGMSILQGGRVTSGSHSPMLEQGIGLAYVPSEHAEPGTALTLDVRGKERRARVVRKPIYSRPDADGSS
jgi:aminomethyltransferase